MLNDLAKAPTRQDMWPESTEQQIGKNPNLSEASFCVQYLVSTKLYALLAEMGSHSRGQHDGGSSPGLSGLMQDVDSYIYELSANQSQNGVAPAAPSSHSNYPQQPRPYNSYAPSSQRTQNIPVCIDSYGWEMLPETHIWCGDPRSASWLLASSILPKKGALWTLAKISH